MVFDKCKIVNKFIICCIGGSRGPPPTKERLQYFAAYSDIRTEVRGLVINPSLAEPGGDLWTNKCWRDEKNFCYVHEKFLFGITKISENCKKWVGGGGGGGRGGGPKMAWANIHQRLINPPPGKKNAICIGTWSPVRVQGSTLFLTPFFVFFSTLFLKKF